MRSEDKYFKHYSDEKIWQRYCGFLDLSTEEFMSIQEELLLDTITLLADSEIGKKIMGGKKPATVEEFRQAVPITTYEDYEPFLSDKNEAALGEKPYAWCHSSGRSGAYKWVPHSPECFEKVLRNLVAACLLSAAKEKGDIQFGVGVKLLTTMPPPPYTSGTMYEYARENWTIKAIPPPEAVEGLDFRGKLQKGFSIAMEQGVDIITAISSVLVRMGETFASQAGTKRKLTASMLRPSVLLRLVRAMLRSRREKRPILPKDLWSPKGIVSSGLDSQIYREEIAYYWGFEPFDFYVSTETFVIALQAWNKRAMSFLPDSVFLEFIPLNGKQDVEQPTETVLIDELKEGELYEVIISQFHGMPLLRYRLNDIIKVVSLEDTETGVTLPQIMIQRKVGEAIYLAGLATLDEKTIWEAISNSGAKYSDWTAVKEYEEKQTKVHIYIELTEPRDPVELANLFHEELEKLDVDYRDIKGYLNQNPLQVTVLSSGTYNRYMEEVVKEGANFAHFKPQRINPTAHSIERLLYLSVNTST